MALLFRSPKVLRTLHFPLNCGPAKVPWVVKGSLMIQPASHLVVAGEIISLDCWNLFYSITLAFVQEDYQTPYQIEFHFLWTSFGYGDLTNACSLISGIFLRWIKIGLQMVQNKLCLEALILKGQWIEFFGLVWETDCMSIIITFFWGGRIP